MEILPLSHRDVAKEGFDVKTPKSLQPSCVMGWVRDGEKEMALVWSMSSQVWLLADGVSPGVPLPRDEQSRVSKLMRPNLVALERGFATAKRVVIEEDDDDDQERS